MPKEPEPAAAICGFFFCAESIGFMKTLEKWGVGEFREIIVSKAERNIPMLPLHCFRRGRGTL
jgi:hypothetical protein